MKKRISHERRNAIAKAVEGGSSLHAVSQAFDVTGTTVRRACLAHGLSLNWPISSQASFRVIALYQQGRTMEAIAAEMGCSRQRVHEIIVAGRDAGIEGI